MLICFDSCVLTIGCGTKNIFAVAFPFKKVFVFLLFANPFSTGTVVRISKEILY